MKGEDRIIKASAMAGFTDIAFGLFMYLTGWGDWYFVHFHFFGMLGVGMIAYAFWHAFFKRWEGGKNARNE
jgi:hypothetical protein